MTEFEPAAEPRRHYDYAIWDSARWQGFEFRDDDVLICSPYKAGSTWTQAIVGMLVFRGTAFPDTLARLSPWMEIVSSPVEEVHATYAAQKHRRFIKTHTPLDGIPYHPGVTYLSVQRDPRDVFMSMLNHVRNFNPAAIRLFPRVMEAGPSPHPPDDVEGSLRLWLTHGSFPWESDGAPYWSVFRHAQSFWENRDKPNIHMLHYADLEADTEGQMRRIAGILGEEIPEDLWPALVNAAGFEQMRSRANELAPNTDVQMWQDNAKFFATGRSGQWKGVLSEEGLALFDEVAGRYPADLVRWLLEGGPAGAPG